MHLHEGDVEGLLAGESLRTGQAAQGHVHQCATCAHQLEQARADDQQIMRLLDTLDVGMPPVVVSIEALIARARAQSWSRRHRRSLFAAGIALLIGAGVAAAAVPQSPLHSYLARWVVHPVPTPSLPHRRSAPEAPRAPTGIAFVPTGSVEIVFQSPQAAGQLRVAVMDVPAVRLTQTGGQARYTLTADGVMIDNAGSRADFDLVLPGTIPHARVRVGPQVVFTKNYSSILTNVTPDRGGVYLISLVLPPGRTP